MSVVGIDVGNESGIVGVARQRGIDVVLNDESKRETPMIASFGEQQRFIGVAGAASQMMNPKNTVFQVKRLIGKKFSDPSVQADIAGFPFSVSEGSNGEALINVMYLNERKSFTPTQILGMILSNLKSIGEKNLGAKVVDCVVGIPVYFTDKQRRAFLDAAAIAGLNPLRLMHETTATALAYGIYKTDLPETDPINVAFVDVGHASLQVCIVAFKKGQLKILSHGFDESLGGRDFDGVLYDHFADEFKVSYKIDVRSNARASLRLRAACEKLKKVLSANPVAPLNIECLMEEKDVRSVMKRDDFEVLAAPILERVKSPILKALQDSGLTVDQISTVEVVGSGSRVPAIMKIIASIFGKEPRRSLNASECIARGCALQCAMLSPTFKVRDFEVQDVYPYPIVFTWKQANVVEGGDGEDTAAQPNQIVFSKNNTIPSSKLLTFYRTDTFTIDAEYANPSELPSGVPEKIGTFTVGPFAPRENVKAKLKVKTRLSLHGILSVDTATLLEEEEVEAPKVTEAEVPKPESQNAPMEESEPSSEKPEVVKKKKTKRTEVNIQSAVIGGLPPVELQGAVEKEFEMALQDRVMEETKDKKNSVEAYVYEMRNKLCDKLQNYATQAEKEVLAAKLQETEDWLYEDGENETKSVYIAKLEELKKLGDPIETRHKEEELRGEAVSQLSYCINSFRAAALSMDPRYDHIDVAEKTKVVEECTKAEVWLAEKQQLQNKLPQAVNPVLLSADVKKAAEALDKFCKPIMTKPKPAPPPKPAEAEPAAAPAAEPAVEEPSAEEKKGEGDDMEVDPPVKKDQDAMETD